MSTSPTTWVFEPGHTAAEFKVKHMMVTWVRGHFKNIAGTLAFDPANPEELSFATTLDAASLDSGVPARDDHLRSADFLDVENHPTITFSGTSSKKLSDTTFEVTGEITIRGTTKEVTLQVDYLGSWDTAYWTDDGDQGPITRLGFEGTVTLNRHDFNVSWDSPMDRGGQTVGNEVHITFDIEALDAAKMKAIEGTE